MKIFDFFFSFSLILLLSANQPLVAQELLADPVEIYSGLPDNNTSAFFSRIGQLDGTGGLDLAASKQALQVALSMSIHLNDGSEMAFNAAPAFASNDLFSFYYFSLADINGDGLDDFVTDIGYYAHTGDFNYELQRFYTDPVLYIFGQGDLNGDNVPDLVLRRGDNLYVGINDGNGNFADPLLINSSNSSTEYLPVPVIADFTGDELADILVYPTYFSQDFFLYVQAPDGSFTTQSLPLSQEELNGGFSPYESHLDGVDYDTDGDLDIVFENDDAVYLLINEGAGVFENVDTLTNKFTASKQQYHDLNQDGVVDIIRTTYSDSSVKIILRNADGSNLDIINILGGAYNSSINPIIVDIDGDGDLDLIGSRRNEANDFTLFLSENNTIIAPNATSNALNLIAHKVFPNPVEEVFTLHIEDLDFTQGTLTILDNGGRILKNTPVQSGDNNINLSGIANGVLYYQLHDQSQQLLATGKLMMQ